MVTAKAEEMRAAPETTISKKRMLIVVYRSELIRSIRRRYCYVCVLRVTSGRVVATREKRVRFLGTGRVYSNTVGTETPGHS